MGSTTFEPLGGREALGVFARGKVDPTFTIRPMTDIIAICTEMEAGQIDGRVVMGMR